MLRYLLPKINIKTIRVENVNTNICGGHHIHIYGILKNEKPNYNHFSIVKKKNIHIKFSYYFFYVFARYFTNSFDLMY